MKKMFLMALLCSGTMAMAQKAKPAIKKTPVKAAVKTTASPACTVLQQLATLANTSELGSVQGSEYSTKYYKALFGAKLYSCTVKLPDILESFIVSDPDDGELYQAIVKDYGSDETAAKADYSVLSKTYAACLAGGKLSTSKDQTSRISLKKAKVELHTFHSSNSDSWVAMLTIAHSNY